ncbi:MAG: hypothetical protein M3Q65_08820 [Chloroflexota bacterium]|nr:hypothetical protein [Chloroflexota bacterium]
MRQDEAGLAREGLEQPEFRGRQPDELAPDPHLAADRVQHYVAHREDRHRPRHALPSPPRRPQARDELERVERLRQVVASAQVERPDLVRRGVAHAEHQDRLYWLHTASARVR